MKQLLEYIVSSLVSKPESVQITEQQKGDITEYSVNVHDDDLGAVIGRGGRIANSIRNVVRTSARKQNKKINIRFE